MKTKIKILFLCTGNSCRSQMAEGFARVLQGDIYDVYSAGLEPHGVNPLAIKIMQEVGVDISNQKSQHLSDFVDIKFDYVITLCGHANEHCPYFPGKLIHQGFDDPPKLAENVKREEDKLPHYRRVRDEIKQFIENLLQEIAP